MMIMENRADADRIENRHCEYGIPMVDSNSDVRTNVHKNKKKNRNNNNNINSHTYSHNNNNNNNNNIVDVTISEKPHQKYFSWHTHVYSNPPTTPTPHRIADILGWNCSDKSINAVQENEDDDEGDSDEEEEEEEEEEEGGGGEGEEEEGEEEEEQPLNLTTRDRSPHDRMSILVEPVLKNGTDFSSPTSGECCTPRRAEHTERDSPIKSLSNLNAETGKQLSRKNVVVKNHNTTKRRSKKSTPTKSMACRMNVAVSVGRTASSPSILAPVIASGMTTTCTPCAADTVPLMQHPHMIAGGNLVESDGQSSDSDKKRKKARTTFTGRQIFELEKQFESKKYLSSSERSEMAKMLGVTETQLHIRLHHQREKSGLIHYERDAIVIYQPEPCKPPRPSPLCYINNSIQNLLGWPHHSVTVKIWFQNRRTKWKKYDIVSQVDSSGDNKVVNKAEITKLTKRSGGTGFGSSGEEHSSLDGSESYFSDGSKAGRSRSPDSSVQGSPSPITTTTTSAAAIANAVTSINFIDVPINAGGLPGLSTGASMNSFLLPHSPS